MSNHIVHNSGYVQQGQEFGINAADPYKLGYAAASPGNHMYNQSQYHTNQPPPNYTGAHPSMTDWRMSAGSHTTSTHSNTITYYGCNSSGVSANSVGCANEHTPQFGVNRYPNHAQPQPPYQYQSSHFQGTSNVGGLKENCMAEQGNQHTAEPFAGTTTPPSKSAKMNPSMNDKPHSSEMERSINSDLNAVVEGLSSIKSEDDSCSSQNATDLSRGSKATNGGSSWNHHPQVATPQCESPAAMAQEGAVVTTPLPLHQEQPKPLVSRSAMPEFWCSVSYFELDVQVNCSI